MSHIKMILEDNEKILWKGHRDVKSSLVAGVFVSIFLCGIGYLLFSVDGTGCTVNGRPMSASACKSSANLISYGLFALGFLSVLSSYLYCLVTEYAVTGKRIIIKSGLIGSDIKTIYYDRIQGLFVDVNIIGKIFATGTVNMDTGRMIRSSKGTDQVDYDSFSHIKEPYKVYKLIQDHLTDRKESLLSGRADFKYNREKYEDFIRETERIKKSS